MKREENWRVAVGRLAVDYKSSLGGGTAWGLGFYGILSPLRLPEPSPKNFGHHGNDLRRDWPAAGSSVGLEGLAAPAAWPASPNCPKMDLLCRCASEIAGLYSCPFWMAPGACKRDICAFLPLPRDQVKLGSRAFWRARTRISRGMLLVPTIEQTIPLPRAN